MNDKLVDFGRNDLEGEGLRLFRLDESIDEVFRTLHRLEGFAVGKGSIERTVIEEILVVTELGFLDEGNGIIHRVVLVNRLDFARDCVRFVNGNGFVAVDISSLLVGIGDSEAIVFKVLVNGDNLFVVEVTHKVDAFEGIETESKVVVVVNLFSVQPFNPFTELRLDDLRDGKTKFDFASVKNEIFH